jgi:hypothetical protein
MKTNSNLTRLDDYIKETLPWAHGHQLKAISAFVESIIETQTGCQAELARTQGNQEAACKRLSRLLHNQRLSPKDLAEWLCLRALEQLPRSGQVRLTIDWTTEGDSICWSSHWSSGDAPYPSSGGLTRKACSKGAGRAMSWRSLSTASN